jgi:hypothetical protein
MDHPVLAGQNLHKCTERHDSHHSSSVFVTDLNILCQCVDRRFCLFSVVAVWRADYNSTVILNIYGYTEFVDHSANHRTTRTDDCAYLVSGHLERKHPRCVFA